MPPKLQISSLMDTDSVECDIAKIGLNADELNGSAKYYVNRLVRIFELDRKTAESLLGAAENFGKLQFQKSFKSNAGKGYEVVLIGTIGQLIELLAELHSDESIPGGIDQQMRTALDGFEGSSGTLRIGSRRFELGTRTFIMGILNVTPDSFSDGGKFLDTELAVAHALEMAEHGADIIDIGGESTRPSSPQVSVAEERSRVMPVIERLLDELKIPISIDTYKIGIAEEALEMGVHMVNDVNALAAEGMAEIVAEYDVPCVLMHFPGGPHRMIKKPIYRNMMGEIISHLTDRIDAAVKAGISRKNLILDPGVGFSKYGAQNLDILRGLRQLRALNLPLLIGTSRKSFIGEILDRPPEERLYGTLASIAICILQNVDFVRVHDVKEVYDVVRLADAVNRKIF